jgi:hypothetical protein
MTHTHIYIYIFARCFFLRRSDGKFCIPYGVKKVVSQKFQLLTTSLNAVADYTVKQG